MFFGMNQQVRGDDRFENMGHSIFTSKDLVNWQFESHFETFHECPELFELPIDGDTNKTKWVTYGAAGYYTIGSFDGKIFTPEFGQFRYVDGEFMQLKPMKIYLLKMVDTNRLGDHRNSRHAFQYDDGIPNRATLETANGIRLFNEPISKLKYFINVRKYKNMTWERLMEA